MPPIETDELNQKAVLWLKTGVDQHAEPMFGDPEEIDVRWEQKRFESKDAFDNTIALEAQVVVDRDIPNGSKMWLGELTYWYGTGSGGQDDQVMQVALYSAIPDVRGDNIRRVVGLVKFRDS